MDGNATGKSKNTGRACGSRSGAINLKYKPRLCCHQQEWCRDSRGPNSWIPSCWWGCQWPCISRSDWYKTQVKPWMALSNTNLLTLLLVWPKKINFNTGLLRQCKFSHEYHFLEMQDKLGIFWLLGMELVCWYSKWWWIHQWDQLSCREAVEDVSPAGKSICEEGNIDREMLFE